MRPLPQTSRFMVFRKHHTTVMQKYKGDADNLNRVMTIAERARRSILSRLVDLLSQVVLLEEELCRSSGHKFSMCPKDSCDLRNISARMVRTQHRGVSDVDLKELRECLRKLVTSLLAVASSYNLQIARVTERLRGILTILSDI